MISRRMQLLRPLLLVVLIFPVFAIAVFTGCDTTLREQIELYVSIKNGGAIYVDGTNGDDGNPGTKDLPRRSIQNAIDLAAAVMDEGQVRVAEGTYRIRRALVVREGISILGGYKLPGWTATPDVGSEPATILQGEGIDAVIRPEKGVTPTTVIQGFLIKAADQDIVTGVWCESCSPTIRYNYVDATDGNTHTFGIYNKYASPIIDGNTINAGGGAVKAFGVWNFHAAPKIWNNVIYGESGSADFRGVYNESGCDVLIQNNTIRVGLSSLDGIGIYSNESTCLVENNIFFSTDSSYGCAIFEPTDTSLLAGLNNNDFYGCASCYRYGNPVASLTFVGMIAYLTGAIASVADNFEVEPRFDDLSGLDPWSWSLRGDDTGYQVSRGGKILDASFTHDRRAAPRTAPWSMGAFEKD